MMNPKDWNGPTPFDHDGQIDKSGMSHWDSPTQNGEQTRKSKATPWNHSGSVGKSGGPNLGNPYATAGDRDELQALAHGNGKLAPNIPASGPEPKAGKVTKWHRRGYTMSVPSTMGGGHMRKPSRNIG